MTFDGADSPEEQLKVWSSVLHILDKCDLRLSTTKTFICPKSTAILRWVMSSGNLGACPQQVTTLSSCHPLTTVKGPQSFGGTYKVLAHVLQNAATLLSPFDDACTRRPSQDCVSCTDTKASATLQSHRTRQPYLKCQTSCGLILTNLPCVSALAPQCTWYAMENLCSLVCSALK